MNAVQARSDIALIFGAYNKLTAADQRQFASLAPGKLYELWVLSKLVEEIARRGYYLALSGSQLKFKASPGHLKLSDPHFTVNGGRLALDQYRIFVDVEFMTMSAAALPSPVLDRSNHYEADILVTASTDPRPPHHETAIIIECKAHANLPKSVIREILGTRREISLLAPLSPCALPDVHNNVARPYFIPANPPVELRLMTIDPKVKYYQSGPRRYGIELIDDCP